jgi:hypothetical protein
VQSVVLYTSFKCTPVVSFLDLRRSGTAIRAAEKMPQKNGEIGVLFHRVIIGYYEDTGEIFSVLWPQDSVTDSVLTA